MSLMNGFAMKQTRKQNNWRVSRTKLDIMQVRSLCKSGALKLFVKDGALYLKDTVTEEAVMIHQNIKNLMQEGQR